MYRLVEKPTFFLYLIMNKLTTLFFFLIFSFIGISQKIKVDYFEVFYNPISKNSSNEKRKYLKEINENHLEIDFYKSNIQELGFIGTFKINKFNFGLGASWWRKEYDFTIGITEFKDQTNTYIYLRKRNIKINFLSIKFVLGYSVTKNSQLCLNISRNIPIDTKHNVALSIDSRGGIIGLNGFEFNDKERINTTQHSNSIGLLYSVETYKQLRFQVGTNLFFSDFFDNNYLYSYENVGKSNRASEESILADIKITSSFWNVFMGITYRFKLN